MDKLLTEAYEEVRFNKLLRKLVLEGKSPEEIEVILKEAGLWDRMKAGAAGLGQKIAGVGSTVAGAAQNLAGKAVAGAGNLAAKGIQAVGGTIDPSQNKLANAGQNMQQAGQQKIANVQHNATYAKMESIFNSHAKEVDTLQKGIINDLKKLGIPAGNQGDFLNLGLTNLRNAIVKANPQMFANNNKGAALPAKAQQAPVAAAPVAQQAQAPVAQQAQAPVAAAPVTA